MDYPTIIENRLAKLMTNLSQDFTIDKFSKSPARFNLAKLEWFNKEYLKMMTLEEFAWRKAQLKIIKKYKNKELLKGDSILIVDFDEQKIFISQKIIKEITEEKSENLGIAKKISIELIKKAKENTNFNYIDGLAIDKVWQNSDAKTEFDSTKMLKICTIQTVENYQEFDLQNRQKTGEIYDGFETTWFVYSEKYQNLQEYCFEIEGEFENYTVLRRWISLDKIIAKNKFINYPIWQNFCHQNQLECFEPNLEILTQYLAWNLDKNRVTKLDEVG